MQEMENELRVLRQKVEGGVTPLQQGTSISKQSRKSGMNSAAVATVCQMPARVDPGGCDKVAQCACSKWGRITKLYSSTEESLYLCTYVCIHGCSN